MSSNPLRVSLENIIPLTEARDHFSQIVTEVQRDKLYVLTKGGKPAVAIIDVKYLEQITGGNVNTSHVEAEIQKNPAKVGRVEMISHAPAPTPTPTPTPIPAPMPVPPPPPPIPTSPPPPPPPPAEPATPISPPPPPPIPKPPVPPKTESTTPTPPLPEPTPPPPSPPTEPAAQIETSYSTVPTQPLTPIKPEDNPKPVAPIEMHPMADIDAQYEDKESATSSDNDRTTPEDKPNPAQYSASSSNVEPDDMLID